MGNAKAEYGRELVAGLRELARRWWQCDQWSREAFSAEMPHTGYCWSLQADAIKAQKVVVREEAARCGIDLAEAKRSIAG